MVARALGLVQLYENTISGPGKKSYKLHKEWKNCTMGVHDLVVAVGLVLGRYLYLCLADGKFVVRDLVNDDNDASYKVFLVDGPVQCVCVEMARNGRLAIAGGGKNNELKVFEVDLMAHSGSSKMASHLGQAPSHQLDAQGFSLGLLAVRSLFLEIKKLLPSFTSTSYYNSYVYKASSVDIITNWIVLVAHANGHFVVGTQFGNVSMYASQNELYPVKTVNLSQFPICNLHPFGNNEYVLYTDLMAKMGVINLQTFRVVNFYIDLREFGPVVDTRIFTSRGGLARNRAHGDVSRFSPIFVLSTTVENKLLVYKLYDDNRLELKFCLQLDCVMPTVDVLGDDPYASLSAMFDGPYSVAAKKRRVEPINYSTRSETFGDVPEGLRDTYSASKGRFGDVHCASETVGGSSQSQMR